MTTTTKIPNGSIVTVRHDLGTEVGTVIGSANVRPGEVQVYTIRFADDTISTWSTDRVTV